MSCKYASTAFQNWEVEIGIFEPHKPLTFLRVSPRVLAGQTLLLLKELDVHASHIPALSMSSVRLSAARTLSNSMKRGSNIAGFQHHCMLCFLHASPKKANLLFPSIAARALPLHQLCEVKPFVPAISSRQLFEWSLWPFIEVLNIHIPFPSS